MKRTLSLVAIVTSVFLSSCVKEKIETISNQDTRTGSSIVEEAYPGQTGSIEKASLYGQPIEFEKINEKLYFREILY
jgi:hypothetical protein